jgi:integrase
MARFTDKGIEALRPKADRYELWEGGGFGLRVSTSGGKSWIWVYHFEGRPRRMTIGSYPAMGLADAHVKLAEARKLLQRSTDPGAKAVDARKADRAAETVADLVEAYLTEWARPKKRSAAEDERLLRKDVIPAWGRRKAKDIVRKDVRALLKEIVDRGSPIAANRTLAVVRRMYSWAMSEDLVESNPCQALKAPGEERRRDRVLSTSEIASLWRALDNSGLPFSRPIRLALKFQFATAQRKGEVIDAEWSEIDLSEAVWTIPAGKAKNKLPHRVPLSPFALELLEQIRSLGGRKWVFPSPRRQGPITGPAIDHAMRDNREALGTGDATPHDLRRTAASQMTSMGISRLVVSKILNHAEPGVASVYDRHSYDGEKRRALDLWARRLQQIIEGKQTANNVVEIARS